MKQQHHFVSRRATIPVDLREKILAAYDGGGVSRQQVAWQFGVSLGLVKKLIQQRRHTGEIAPRHDRSGRKPKIKACHQLEMKELLDDYHYLTLADIRDKLRLKCSLQAIHQVQVKMGIPYRKRRAELLERLGIISPDPSFAKSRSKSSGGYSNPQGTRSGLRGSSFSGGQKAQNGWNCHTPVKGRSNPFAGNDMEILRQCGWLDQSEVRPFSYSPENPWGDLKDPLEIDEDFFPPI